jgi:hypothetical protein
LAQARTWPRWTGAPLVFSTPTHVVLATTPLSAAWIAAHDDAAATLRTCRGITPPPAGGEAGGAWHAFDAYVGSAPVIMLQIMPAMRSGRASCEGADALSPALVARGISVQEHPTYDEYENPRGARVRIGGRVVQPVLYGRVPVEIASPTPWHVDTLYQLRLYLPAAALEPDSLGRPPRVTVRVWGRDTSSAVDFDVPTAVVRQLWNDFLPWQLERGETVARGGGTVSLPAPTDSMLKEAWQRYRAGDWRVAALLTHERFYHSAPTLSRDDSLAGRVQLALALLAMNDTALATPVIADVMHDSPCLTLAPTAPQAYEQRFDRVRPRARCDVAVGRTIANGVVLPGYGQLSRGRPFGIVFSAGTAVAMTIAVLRYSASRSDYRGYQANLNTQAMLALYDKASDERRAARNAALTGAGVWLIGAIEAGIHELRHGREVHRVQGYGAMPIVRSSARTRTTDVGLAFSF